MSPLLAGARIALLPPQGYLEMLGLLAQRALVLTDSGGIQEETTALAVPCLTMRDNTERPITVEQGTNTLVGRDRALALACVDDDPRQRRQARAGCPSSGTATRPSASPPILRRWLGRSATRRAMAAARMNAHARHAGRRRSSTR